METTSRETTSKQVMRRKIIDIKQETFRRLSVVAASRGTNLKHFIESSLDELVEAYDAVAVYRYLQQTYHDGGEMLNEEEQAAFEKKYSL